MECTPFALIIEDSLTQARRIAANLSQHGFQTAIVGDGIEGLRMIDLQPPDLVVLDVNLPTMDGYQVCRRLKRDPQLAHILVVMLSEFDGSGATIRGLKAGADDYIPKDTFAAENLTATLRSFGLIA